MKALEEFQEMLAGQHWLVNQLLEHVPPEIAERILVDFEVNEADPDFCFFKAVFGDDPPSPKPLAVLFKKRSSTG